MKIKFNRIYKLKGKKKIYSNMPIYVPVSLDIKNVDQNTMSYNNKQCNENGESSLIPSLSLSLYQNNQQQHQHQELQPQQKPSSPQSSPQKQNNNHSSSYDRFLFGISRDKIMSILLKKAHSSSNNNHVNSNHNVIKSEVNNDIQLRERKNNNNPLLNSIKRNKNINMPISQLNFMRYSFNKPTPQQHHYHPPSPFESLKDKSTIPSTPKPYLASTTQTNIIKLNLKNQCKKEPYYKNYSRSNNNNTTTKGLCFPNNMSNSYTQISKMNTLLLNKVQSSPITKNHSNNNNNNDIHTSSNSTAINHDHYHTKNKYIIPINPRNTEDTFDARDIDEHVMNEIIINVPISIDNKMNMKKSNSNDTIALPNESESNISLCNEKIIDEWNNLSSFRRRVKEKDSCSDYTSLLLNTPLKHEDDCDMHLHQSRSTLMSNTPINDNGNINGIKTKRDTLIYSNDYYTLIKKISQQQLQIDHENNTPTSSLSQSEIEENNCNDDAEMEDDIINNDNEDISDSANENISLKDHSSKIVPLFKTLKFSDKTPLSISSSITYFLPYIAQYLPIKTLIIIMQVDTHLYNKASPIFYRKITSMILYSTNEIIHYNILSSVMPYSPLFNKNYGHIYLSYLYRKSNYTEAISKDLGRTIPDDSSFNEGSVNNNKLRNILTAYANYNKKIGYAQGMNFLVAHGIYCFNKECDVFLFIDGMIHKFQLEELYGVDNRLQYKMDILGKLFKVHIPKIIKHLEIYGLCHEFFTSNWVLTLFANSMKNKYVFALWDMMVLFGWKFFYYFSVKILQWYQQEIITTEVRYLSALMKNLLKRRVFEENFQIIIEETFRIMK